MHVTALFSNYVYIFTFLTCSYISFKYFIVLSIAAFYSCEIIGINEFLLLLYLFVTTKYFIFFAGKSTTSFPGAESHCDY